MTEKSSQLKVTLAFALLCIVWGTTYLGIDIAVRYISPFMLAGLRHLIAGSIFLAIALLKGEKLPSKSLFLQLTKLGLLLIVGGNALVCWAEKKMSNNSGLTAIICSLSPMIITLMSVFFFKNFRITARLIVGLVMGFLGIVFIFYQGAHLDLNQENIIALFLLFAAILSWALGSIMIKSNPIPLSIFMSIGSQMLIAGVISTCISLFFEDNSHLLTTEWRGIAALMYLVVVGSLMGYASYLYVLGHYPPARVSMHSYINTLIAVFVGWLLNGEKMNIFIIMGTFIVLAGLLIVNREYGKLAKKL